MQINFYTKQTTQICFDGDIVTSSATIACDRLKQTIASNYNVDEQNIALFPQTDLYTTLFRSLKEKKVYLYTPIDPSFEKAAFRANKFLSKINRLSDIENPPAKKSIVVFCNPAQPEGEMHDINELLRMWMKLKCTIIIDESYIDFENLTSARDTIKEYKKLYIIHSFTPFYATQGVPLSALFAHKKTISKLSLQTPTLSALDAAFFTQLLDDAAFKTKAQEEHAKQKQELNAILEETNLFDEVAPSNANFILCYTPRGKELYEHLQKHNIEVQSAHEYDYLSENWLRFRVQEHNAQIKLKEVLLAFT